MNERYRPRSGFVDRGGGHREPGFGGMPIAVAKNGSLLEPVVEFARAAFALACNSAELPAANQASHHVTMVTIGNVNQSIPI